MRRAVSPVRVSGGRVRAVLAGADPCRFARCLAHDRAERVAECVGGLGRLRSCHEVHFLPRAQLAARAPERLIPLLGGRAVGPAPRVARARWRVLRRSALAGALRRIGRPAPRPQGVGGGARPRRGLGWRLWPLVAACVRWAGTPPEAASGPGLGSALWPDGHGRALCIHCGRSTTSVAVTLQRHPCVPAGRWPPGAASALRADLNTAGRCWMPRAGGILGAVGRRPRRAPRLGRGVRADPACSSARGAVERRERVAAFVSLGMCVHRQLQLER